MIWTLPAGRRGHRGTAWAAVTPQGTGLASTSAENAITALAADGVTLTGVGFTAELTASGTPGAQQPTLWQSPDQGRMPAERKPARAAASRMRPACG